ncbi:hypothetical protein [Aminobacter sp. BE322]|uniref:hypothetical protein n=1 Tax=unclassified Aminobacter TaxID=2644704 RepID=UPI003D222F3A
MLIVKSRPLKEISESEGSEMAGQWLFKSETYDNFEFTCAEIGLGTTSVAGDMEMAFADSWAHFCVHHFDQNGLVRERSRLTAWLERMGPRSRE